MCLEQPNSWFVWLGCLNLNCKIGNVNWTHFCTEIIIIRSEISWRCVDCKGHSELDLKVKIEAIVNQPTLGYSFCNKIQRSIKPNTGQVVVRETYLNLIVAWVTKLWTRASTNICNIICSMRALQKICSFNY